MTIKSVFSIVGAAALLAVAAVTPGCASSGAPLLTATTNSTPNIQTELQTNVVTVTTTNSLNQTNIVNTTNVVPVQVTNYATVVTYSTAPALANTLSTVQGLNTLTAPLDPFSGWVTLALGLATAGLGFYAKQKTADANTHASVAATVINAVEGLAPAVGDGVKAAVTAQSLKQGTYVEVNNAVQDVTSGLGLS